MSSTAPASVVTTGKRPKWIPRGRVNTKFVDYEPHGNCKVLFTLQVPELIISGPAGCVAGETELWDPIALRGKRFDELCERNEQPIVQTLNGPVLAEVPFVKGKADLYRVTLANGESCVVKDDHLFLTSSGWVLTSDLAPGMPLLSSSREDVLRYSKTTEDSQDDYPIRSRLYDEQLPLVSKVVPSSLPLRCDARRRSYSWLRGDQASTVASIPSDFDCHNRYDVLPATQNSTGQKYCETLETDQGAVAMLGVEDCAWSCSLEEYCDSYLLHVRSNPALLLLQPSFSLHWETSHTLLQSRDASNEHDSLCLSSCLDSLSCSCFHSFRTQWVPLRSIKYERTDYYYDLHVPVEEHYLANGMWHHNTGKSRAALEKCNWLCEKYRRTRGIMIRKTRRSMTQSCVVTFEQEVLPTPDYVPFHGSDQEYRYPNGSIFALAGIDDPRKIYSSQWDFAYVNQAEELTEDEWEQIRSRLRNYRMPYQQLLGDVNPDAPQHWIKTRSVAGALTLLESRHEDNPVYWDDKVQDWTDKGRSYVLGTLESLTGVRKRRLRYGQWAAAEGAVYEDSWDRAHHVIDRFVLDDLTHDQVPKDWPRYWAIDFGYKNPFVWQAWAEDPDGRMFRYKEIYKTSTIVEDHARKILEVTKDEPKPRVIVCDHDAEDRATLEKHLGMRTKGAYKAVSAGIQAVEHRLRKDPLGKARIFYLRDSVIEIDQSLRDSKQPTCTEDEMECYCLIAGTMISTEHGPRSIETVCLGDRVWTREGLKVVSGCGKTQDAARVFTAAFSDGSTLTGTGNHPVWMHGLGWTPLRSIPFWGRVHTCPEKELPFLYDLMESSIRDIQTQRTAEREITSGRTLSTRLSVFRRFIETSGGFIADRFHPVAIFITKMRTHLITGLQIWYASLMLSTLQFTQANGVSLPDLWLCSRKHEILLSTTKQLRQKNSEIGRKDTQQNSGRTSQQLKDSALFAKLRSSVGVQRKVLFAPLRVISVDEQRELQPVYNLTVEGCTEYFANGVLVHNCWDTSANRRKGEEPKKAFDHGMDVTRYITAEVDQIGKFTPKMFGILSVTKSGDSGTSTNLDRPLARPGGWHMDTNAPRRFGGGS